MINLDIRIALLEKGITQKRVAQELHMTEGNFSTLLRMELKPQKREQILAVIDQLAEQDGRA